MVSEPGGLEADARRGFAELFQDRLLHLPEPAARVMADAIFTVAGLRQWEAWPEAVDLDGEPVELPTAVHAVVADIRDELERRLAAGDTGDADPAVVRAIAARLARFPPAPGDGGA